ncbi:MULTISPECIES: IS5 family transposase [unclassified Mesorhizobium]|uniref:IS5 family transposase n=1 Tax=unclassified Mesorhizobium TaxID=325217 RepID=UPI0003CE80E6|nr:MULTISPECIES: IS5 family transposase [unclassified Mesorhizobium]ESY09249.1 transposase [Mesorhizobium sp. LNJC395A00]WJI74740.1 IS5 family transposase [Mesorhizobium sp. C395A]
MYRDYFWLSKEQFERLESHLPSDTRGKPRGDHCRVVSGIVHVLKSGCRWVDAPSVYGPRKTLYNRFVRWAAKGIWEDISMPWHRGWSAGAGADRLFGGEGSSLRLGRKRGELTQAIGRSRGGRTTKIYALTDRFCRPIAFLLTGGQVADCTAADTLLDQMPAAVILHGDKGYDSDAVRRKIESKGAAPNVPPKVNRRWKNCFSPYLYRERNAIERMFGRLKNSRRIATRYDRLAHNLLAAVCLAAIVGYWL